MWCNKYKGGIRGNLMQQSEIDRQLILIEQLKELWEKRNEPQEFKVAIGALLQSLHAQKEKIFILHELRRKICFELINTKYHSEHDRQDLAYINELIALNSIQEEKNMRKLLD